MFEMMLGMGVTKADIYMMIALVIFVFAVQVWLRHIPVPSLDGFLQIVSMLNSKGGIIMTLLMLWLFTLSAMIVFSVWIIVKGIDPQNAVVVTLLGVLVGQAFGNVNGALFKTMTGEEPSKPTSTVSTTTSTVVTKPIEDVKP